MQFAERARPKDKVSTDIPSYLVNLCVNSRQKQLFLVEKDISTKKPGILIISSSVCSRGRPPAQVLLLAAPVGKRLTSLCV